ncbi:MAG: zf-HC2 domain-containing protein [Planctomycetota bacterium]|jgi:anti-sigma factor RsiW
MRCRKTQRLLSGDELSEAQQRAVDGHLQRCPACRQYKAQLDLLASRLVPLMPVPEPRAGFAGRTLARIPDDEPQPGWLDRLTDLLHPAPVALAAAMLALGIFLAATMNGAADEPTDPQTAIFAEFFGIPTFEEP